MGSGCCFIRDLPAAVSATWPALLSPLPAGMLCPLCPLCPWPLSLCRSQSSVFTHSPLTKRPRPFCCCMAGCTASLQETGLSVVVSSKKTENTFKEKTETGENTLTDPKSFQSLTDFQVHVTRDKVWVNTAKCLLKLALAGKNSVLLSSCAFFVWFTQTLVAEPYRQEKLHKTI